LAQSLNIFLYDSLDDSIGRASVSFLQHPRPRRSDRTARADSDRRPRGRQSLLLWLTLSCLPFIVTGCTKSLNPSAELSSSKGSLEVSPGTVVFGDVLVGQGASSVVSIVNEGSVEVQISSVSVAGAPFSVSGVGASPITLPAGGTYDLSVSFSPKVTGAVTGTLTIVSNSLDDGSITVGLSGTGTGERAPALSGLTCAGNSFSGPATTSCGVTTSAAAGSGGVTVALTSNDSAVSVPSSVIVPAGATSATFTASVNAVNTPQTATLTAIAGSVSQSVALQLGATAVAITASTNAIAFGNVNVNTTSSQQVTLTSSGDAPVTINSVTIAGSGFSVSGFSAPQTLNPNQTMTLNVQFDPTTPGAATGQLNVASNAPGDGSTTIGLTGTGTILILPALNSLGCVSGSFIGPATVVCTVMLNGTAPAGGMNVNLESSAAAVTVPAVVEIPSGAASTSFTATIAAVSAAESVTLTATANNSAESFSLQLGAYLPTLGISASGLEFGSDAVGTARAQTITLSSTGNAPVTVSAAAVSGSGFTVSGPGFPMTLNPNQTATLTVQFDPTSAGAVTGSLTLSSNSSTGPTTTVALSGTGVPVLTGLTCVNNSMTGAGTDNCTLTLNAAAPGDGFPVSLVSSSGSVAVPATVTVASGSTSAGFAATATAVSAAATVTLTASAGGVAESFALQLGASIPTLGVSTTSLAFGNVGVNSAGTQSVVLTSTGSAYVTVNAAAVSGSAFSGSGASFPLTLSPNQTATLTVQFDPTAAGPASGTLTLSSNSSTGSSTIVDLSGTGVPELSGLTCASGTVTGSGTVDCAVTINAAAASGGFPISLASNNSAVTLPSTVTIPGGVESAGFAVKVASVSSSQVATLTAVAGGVTETFALQLNASSAQLNVSATSLSFGSVNLNTAAAQSVTLTSSSALPVTVSLATVVGAGFSLTGGALPATLTTSQNATFTVQFDPTAAGASNGTLTIITTSLTNPIIVVNLSGTGVASSYEVNLSWGAPANSPDPVAGYNVYRSADGGITYQVLNSSLVTQTAYTDTGVQDGLAYSYFLESVDASGVPSVPSNTAVVTIP